ncbi:MAG: hypothetical protein ACJASX_001659 [Limisphaerales bacterium]|jgi:hypothetical protein
MNETDTVAIRKQLGETSGRAAGGGGMTEECFTI